MKLYCVGKTASSPCLVLQFRGATVMLDCALDMSSVWNFTPLASINNEKISYGKTWSTRELEEVEGFTSQSCLKEISGKVFIDSEPEVCSPEDGLIDFSHIDVILISNYHFMLALPFITEFSRFSGKIYATDPTLQLGRELMLELVSFAERVPKPCNGTMWKESDVLRCLPSPLCDLSGVKAWRTMYSKRDVKACISKIETVGYNEKLDLFGVLELTALSSGFCIGSCNWVLQSHYEKISYVSSSSTFTTHPLPMDQSQLKGCDLMILAGMTEAPTANPDGMLGEFCTHLANTVKNGGNVLVPCYPAGVLYDLFECLQSYMDSASLSSIPIYFISPVADSSLAYSNIFAEWLCQSKQTKVYLPEPPFPHGELVKNGRLKHYASLHEGLSNAFKTPCVVFCGHPSLRYGDAVHFMELWGKSSGNTVIFTEPDFPYLEALAPFQPLAMKACYCPIDPRINFSQANKLIREMKPGHLVVPESYTRPPSLLPHRSDLVIQDVECKVSTYNFLDVLSLPITRAYEKVALSTEVASNIHPQEVRPGIAVATVTGTLVTKDNRYTLEPLDFTAAPETDLNRNDEPEPKRFKALSRHLWGTVIVDDLLQALEKKGIQDVHVESSQAGVILHLADDDAMIQLERGSTHIITHGNETLRKRIRDAFLECVSHF